MYDTCPNYNNVGTLHGYQQGKSNMQSKKIDYIFCSVKGDYKNYEVIKDKCWNNQFGENFFASDHHPVYCEIDFGYWHDTSNSLSEGSLCSEDINRSNDKINSERNGSRVSIENKYQGIRNNLHYDDSSSSSANLY